MAQKYMNVPFYNLIFFAMPIDANRSSTKVILEKFRGEVSPMGQDIIENVS